MGGTEPLISNLSGRRWIRDVVFYRRDETMETSAELQRECTWRRTQKEIINRPKRTWWRFHELCCV